MTRILIADDHNVVREGLRRLLDAQRSCEVLAEASDGNDAVLKAIEAKPPERPKMWAQAKLKAPAPPNHHSVAMYP